MSEFQRKRVFVGLIKARRRIKIGRIKARVLDIGRENQTEDKMRRESS